MDRNQPLPRLWLMTDERLGDSLFAAIGRLPREGGIVFRHYGLAGPERRRLFDRIRAAAEGRLLLLAGPWRDARAWGADGSHGRGPGEGLRTTPVHDEAELRAAESAGAALVFISPVYPTRSHPGAPALGDDGFLALARSTTLPAVALGGMNVARGRALMARGAYGWAAVDAWSDSSPDAPKNQRMPTR
jgi:thiamine-phosphate pyrophosphorylase